MFSNISEGSNGERRHLHILYNAGRFSVEFKTNMMNRDNNIPSPPHRSSAWYADNGMSLSVNCKS